MSTTTPAFVHSPEDHRAILPALIVHRGVHGLRGSSPMEPTSLGRQGLAEVVVTLTAMLPDGWMPPRVQGLYDAMHAGDVDRIAAVLDPYDRAGLNLFAREIAALLPVNLDPAEALAWLD